MAKLSNTILAACQHFFDGNKKVTAVWACPDGQLYLLSFKQDAVWHCCQLGTEKSPVLVTRSDIQKPKTRKK